jgi:hypothetical protein
VRTGKDGMNGLSVLLIEREAGGVSTRRMDCQGVWSIDDVMLAVLGELSLATQVCDVTTRIGLGDGEADGVESDWWLRNWLSAIGQVRQEAAG